MKLFQIEFNQRVVRIISQLQYDLEDNNNISVYICSVRGRRAHFLMNEVCFNLMKCMHKQSATTPALL